MSKAKPVTGSQRRLTGLLLIAVVFLVALLANGCMVGPNFQPPQPIAPNQWVGVVKAPAGQLSEATAQPADLAEWWRQFSDPMLTALTEEALRRNLDLQIAETRLRQARASRGIAAGGLWPSVTASGSYQLLRQASGASGNQNLYLAGFDSVWELDLFGGVRRAVESADANIQAALEGIRDAQVSLIAEVALNYVQLRGYQQEIVIAQKNLEAQRHTADITHKLFSVGFASALDVANADSNVATTESQIPVFEIAAQQSIYSLSVLLARHPADLLDQLLPFDSLPKVPAQVPAGLPSDLLRRRPDIRMSEAKLHAATAQIGVAVADFFPVFSLTGTASWGTTVLHMWSHAFTLGPSVTWPIFQGGAIVSNVHLQEALRDQAFITYQETVLSAFQDVENALIAFTKEQQHRKVLKEAVEDNRKAVEMSLQLYTEGLGDFLNVLVAQRSLYTSEDSLVQSERNIATDLIALYKALGGGWDYAQTTSSSPGRAPAETESNIAPQGY